MPVLRDMRHVAKRMVDREKRLVREQKKYEEAEGLQKTAQMLTSSGMKMDQHYESVRVTDYFGAEPATRDVALDSTISLKRTSTESSSGIKKRARARRLSRSSSGRYETVARRSRNKPNDCRPSRIGTRGSRLRARFRARKRESLARPPKAASLSQGEREEGSAC